ncbi:unnamed protein product [Medioppia subpectinata]|uniref:Dolichyldiphosphatase 1 n=1 Tax=Medioppia subpectinata TaxID=1979941 RepID=A0A7R9KIJ3_9ACAR|nr:unnamed protein product [Medioppia subpectinata]CAG2102990.1 unnamed protein product [Medioppia subpectinata]
MESIGGQRLEAEEWIPLSITHVLYPKDDIIGQLLALLSLTPFGIVVAFITLTLFVRDIHVIFFFGGQLMNEALCLVLKRVFRQPRPQQVVGAAHHSNRSYGMPSQHSQFMAFFTAYCLLFFVFRLKRKSYSFKALLVVAITTLFAGVVYSRIYLLYHYWSQCLVGIAVGVVFASLTDNTHRKDLHMDYKRDSFGDRVCDDLCQLVLNWLPLKDKVRMSGVSKQFQRCLKTVRSQQRRLIIGDVDRWTYSENYCPGKCWKWLNMNVVDIDQLVRYLRAFDRIEEFHIVWHKECLDQVMNVVVDNCHHIQHLTISGSLSLAVSTRLIDKYGQQLLSLEFIRPSLEYPPLEPELLAACPRLLSLSGVYFSHLVRDNQVIHKHLKKLVIEGRINANTNGLFTTFVDNCHELTRLEISLYKNDTNQAMDIVESISKLQSLKALKLHLNVHQLDNNFCHTVRNIARKCPKIRSLDMTVAVGEYYDFRRLFIELGYFRNLKKLSFDTRKYSPIDINELLDINNLRGLKRLTHLKVSSDQIGEEFLSQMSDALPQLKSLRIIMSGEITDQTMRSLARLRHLELLDIKIYETDNENDDLMSVTDEGVEALVNGCHGLHTILMQNSLNISENLIHALIRKAVQNPDIYYTYRMIGVNIDENVEQFLMDCTKELTNITFTGWEDNSHRTDQHMDYKRDSFGDRICDDLCQLVLNWLPLKDKVRMSGVSKQFQRCLQTVRSEQRWLVIGHVIQLQLADIYSENYCPGGDIWLSNGQSLLQMNVVDIDQLVRYLRAFDGLQEFQIGCLTNNLDHVMDAVVDNCHHIQHLTVPRSPSLAVSTRLADKYGQHLRSLEFIRGPVEYPPLLAASPRLLSLSGVYFSHLVRDNQVIHKHLKKLVIEGRVNANTNGLFTTFVDNCHELTRLEISLFKNDTNQAMNIVESISKLQSLKALKLHLNVHQLDNNFCHTVRNIARKCPKIRSLDMTVAVEQYYDFRRLFIELGYFRNLQKLSFDPTKMFPTYVNEVLDINTLRGLKRLTHLKVSSDQIGEEFLSQMSDVLPQLKSLQIIMSGEITDQTMRSLARLRHIELFDIQKQTFNGNDDLMSVTDGGVEALVNGCHAVQNRYIHYTYRTIGVNIDVKQIVMDSTQDLTNIQFIGF